MQLENVSDPELFIPYALWVVGKDEEKGLTVGLIVLIPTCVPG